MAALGECGRFPMYITQYTKCIKYWLQVIQLPEHRYPKQIYNMLLEQDRAGRVNWVSHIKAILGRYGYQEIWQQQVVGSSKPFLQELKVKMQQEFKDKWERNLRLQDKLCTYRDFKQVWGTETYVRELQDFRLRSALARFRCSNHNLRIEKDRGLKHISDRKCERCNCIEDEYHCLAKCPKYEDIRQKYLGQVRIETYSDFIDVMKTEETDTIRKVAWFTLLANKAAVEEGDIQL